MLVIFKAQLLLLYQRYSMQDSIIIKQKNMRKLTVELKPVQNRLKINRDSKADIEKLRKEGKQNSVVKNLSKNPSDFIPKISLISEKNEVSTLKPNSPSKSIPKRSIPNETSGNFQLRVIQIKGRINNQRSLSVCQTLKRSQSAEKSRQNTFRITDSSNVKQIAQKIVASLLQNISMVLKGGLVCMKKEHFIEFLEGLLKKSLGIDLDQSELIRSKFRTIYQDVESLCKLFRKNTSKLRMKTRTVDRKINPYEFRHEFRETTTKMSILISEKEGLEEAVQRLTNKKLSVETICSEKERETREFEMKLYDSRAEYDSITQRLEDIAKRLQEEEARLARVEEDAAVRMKHIEEEAEKVRTFVERQKERPIMEYVAQAYRHQENELLDYAEYLQNDALFSSLTWEPKPFSTIEKFMQQDLKRTAELLSNGNMSPEEKGKMMRELLLDSFGKFSNKDKEMMRVTRQKTVAIRKFVNLMQKWVSNFDIKKDTLLDLRKQFVVDSEAIAAALETLALSFSPKNPPEAVAALKKHWLNVVDNYHYGNYFY